MNESLRLQLSEISEVLNLKNNPAWQTIMRDAQANFDSISHSWFEWEEGSKELRMARARQIANKTILSLMDLYEAKLNEIGMEVIQKENPELIQTTDVDNNYITEDEDDE